MRITLLHTDAQGDGELRTASDEVVALCCASNMLGMESDDAVRSMQFEKAAASGVRTIVAWSGSMGESLFQADPRTWMQRGRSQFDTLCDAIAAAAESYDLRVLFRPHMRHALSDTPGCRAFVERWGGSRLGLAIDPVSMCTASMLHAADEHLDRLFTAVGSAAEVVVLAGCKAGAAADGPLCHAPLGAGPMPAAILGRMVKQYVASDATLALIPGGAGDPGDPGISGDTAAQLAAAGLAKAGRLDG